MAHFCTWAGTYMYAHAYVQLPTYPRKIWLTGGIQMRHIAHEFSFPPPEMQIKLIQDWATLVFHTYGIFWLAFIWSRTNKENIN